MMGVQDDPGIERRGWGRSSWWQRWRRQIVFMS